MKMHKHILPMIGMLLLSMAIIVACQKDKLLEKVDEQGVVFQKQPIWKIVNSDDLQKPGNGPAFGKFIDGYLMDGYADDPANYKFKLSLLNTETGTVRWQWRDLIRVGEELSLLDYQGAAVYQFNNLLLYQYGPRNYCINVENGTTVWRKSTGYSGIGLCYGLGSTYFTFGTPLELFDKGYWEQSIYRGDIQTGKEEKILTPRYSRRYVGLGISQYHVGAVNDVRPMVVAGDTLLLVTYSEQGPKIHEYEGYLSLYNLSKKIWVYDRKPLWGERKVGILNGAVRVRGDKMYTITSNEVVCHNWRTGERLWLKVLPSFAEIQGIFEDRYMVLYDSMSTLY